jgi:hypothetical protein
MQGSCLLTILLGAEHPAHLMCLSASLHFCTSCVELENNSSAGSYTNIELLRQHYDSFVRTENNLFNECARQKPPVLTEIIASCTLQTGSDCSFLDSCQGCVSLTTGLMEFLKSQPTIRRDKMISNYLFQSFV